MTNGWSTSYTHNGTARSRSIATVGGDGVEAFSSAHTREDGGTNMNNKVYDGTTYNLPFDYAGLKAAYTTVASFVDPRGNPMVPNLDTVVVKKNSAAHFKAKEIKKAIENNKIPESNDNDGSGVNTFNIVDLDYLTQSGYWFIFDSSMLSGDTADKYGFQFVQSQDISLMPMNVVYKTSEIQFKAESMFDLGFSDVSRMWVGSNGTSS